MLVALIYTRTSLLLLVSFLILGSAQISYTNDLSNMQVSSDKGFSIDLYSIVKGPNLTFTLTGNYTPALSTSGISIEENLSLVYSMKKSSVSKQYHTYGPLQTDYTPSRQILYTLESPFLKLWSIAQFPSLSNLTSYKIQTTATVISLENPTVYNTTSKKYDYFIATIENSGTSYAIRIINVNDINNIYELTSLKTTRAYTSFTRGTFYSANEGIWGFIYYPGGIDVFSFNLTGTNSTMWSGQWLWTINATTLQAPSAITPVSLIFYGQSGYFCDQNFGVYKFSLDNLSKNSSTFTIQQKFFAPSTFGLINSCTINSGLMTVDTSAGPVVYSLPSYDLSIVYPFNSTYPILQTWGMVSDESFTIGYVNTVVDSKTTIQSFRVYSTSLVFMNSLLIDVPIGQFLQSDLTNLNPAYTIIEVSSGTYVVVNGGMNLMVYYIAPGAILTFPSQTQAYNYSGTLLAHNGGYGVSIPVNLEGISTNSSLIFTGRGVYASQGYIADTDYAEYVLTTNGSSYISYVPLSNYYSGANIAYNLQCSDAHASITVPAKNVLQNQYIISTQNILQPAMSVVKSFGTDTVAVVSNNSVTFFVIENYAKQEMFTVQYNGLALPNFVSLYKGQGVYAVVESSGVAANNSFMVYWDVYDVSHLNPVPIQTIVFANSVPSVQLEFGAAALYSLYGYSIDVYNVNTTGGFKLYYFNTVYTETITPQIGFSPLSFTPSLKSLYVYDQTHGLLTVTVLNSTTFLLTTNNITLSTGYQIQMMSDSRFMFILVNKLSQFSLYKIPLNAISNYTMQSLAFCSAPIAISYSYPLLGVLCSDYALNHIQVYDMMADSYSSLYTQVMPATSGMFSLGSSFISKGGVVYFSDGEKLSVYSIGQVGDSSWSPKYPVSYRPSNDFSIPTWAKLNLTFNYTTYNPSYTYTLQLSASNQNLLKTQPITYTLYNTAAYLETNTNYNPSSSNLTFGSIDLSTDFAEPLPLSAFVGNNLEYAFLINSSTTDIRKASEVCTNFVDFCLENKTYEYASVPGYFYDFDISATQMTTTNSTMFSLYNITGTGYELVSQMPTSSLIANSLCYQVRLIPKFNVFIASCTVLSSAVGQEYFLTAGSFTSQRCSSGYSLINSTVWMQTHVNSAGITFIYNFDGTSLTIIRVTSLNTGCQVALTLVGTITQNSLFIASFQPIGLWSLGGGLWLMAETNLGLVFLTGLVVNSQFTFTVTSTFMPSSNVLTLSSSTLISMNLLSDFNTALLVMSTADVYKVRLDPLTVLEHFPKIMLNAYVPNNKLSAVDENSTMLAFPVFNTQTNGTIRLLNYSQTFDTAIYKDRVISQVKDSGYPQRVQFIQNATTVLVHNLNPTNVFSSSQDIHIVLVRSQPMGYIKSTQLKYNGTIALIAYNNQGFTQQYQGVSYFYPGEVIPDEVSSGTSYYRSDWNKWYFWLILSIFSLVLVASIITVYMCVSKRNRSSSTLSIGLTTVNP